MSIRLSLILSPILRTTRLVLLPAVALLLAAGAQAQSAGCDQFKATLASRVNPGITGFTLDIVRSDAPTPAGAKVFGTCDGGAYKILFRRGGNTRPAPADASATAPASAPAVATAAAPKPRPSPAVASAPSATPPALARAVEPASAPLRGPQLPVNHSAEPEAAASSIAQAQSDKPAVVEEAQPAQASAGFMDDKWQWLWALILVPFAAWLWGWIAHRRAYDEAGLPRGPKIRV